MNKTVKRVGGCYLINHLSTARSYWLGSMCRWRKIYEIFHRSTFSISLAKCEVSVLLRFKKDIKYHVSAKKKDQVPFWR